MISGIFARQVQALKLSVGQILRRPVSTLMASAAIGIALSIPMLLYLVVENVSASVSDWRQGPGVTLYLKPELDDQAGQELAENLGSLDFIDQALYIDKTLGLDLFLSEARLGPAAGLLEQNPLPGVIEVQFAVGVAVENIDEWLDRLAGDNRIDAIQRDLEWVLRLQALLDLVMRSVMVLWILLLTGVSLIISNTVRMSVISARDEIEVVSLVGGSDSYIRRPFVYSGALQGLLGALFACLVLILVLFTLGPPLLELLRHYGVEIGLGALPWGLMFVVVGLSVILGWVSAWVSVTRYLRGLTNR